jgi:hypothetical protein
VRSPTVKIVGVSDSEMVPPKLLKLPKSNFGHSGVNRFFLILTSPIDTRTTVSDYSAPGLRAMSPPTKCSFANRIARQFYQERTHV